jgi:hypothetical protein
MILRSSDQPTSVTAGQGDSGLRSTSDLENRQLRSVGSLGRSSPQADLVNAFDQVVEPLITEITCLRSHELRLFHLVSAFIGSPLGGTTG